MLTAQFRIMLWPRPAANGQFPVKCCIAFKGTRRYYNTGLTSRKVDWESSNARFLDKNRAKDNELLNSLSVRGEKILRDWLKDNTPFSFDQFEKEMFAITGPATIPTISQLLNDSAAQFDQQNKISSCDTRRTIAALLHRILPRETPATISPEHIQKLISTMKAAGLSQNTIRTYTGIMAAELRPYQKRGITSIDVLDACKVSARKPPKHAIHREEMRLFENYQADTPAKQFYIDLFIFCFYVRGINLADIARMRPDNITHSTTLSYQRKKTEAPIHIRLLPPAIRILEKYRTTGAEYIFPILLRPDLTERQIVGRIGTVARHINLTIRQVAAELNLPKRPRPISFYTARHTYATTLKRSGVDIGVISELIGHSDVRTTRTYLDSFEDDTLSQADQLLL